MVDVREMPFVGVEGSERHGHIRVQTTFNKELFDQISAEAKRRDWSFSRMVRHLCEASIDGIE